MRFALDSQHHFFFLKNHYLCLEALLTPEECSRLQTEVTHLLAAKKANTPFLAGRDLWRTSAIIKKTSLSFRLAQLARELFKSDSIRLGYDQYLFPPFPFEKPTSLQEISSLNPLVGGVLLALENHDAPSLPFLPSVQGSGTFISPSYAIPWHLLPASPYLLIVYTKGTTLYVSSPKDPHTHALKRLGYAFGDRLRSEHHPLLYRQR